MTFIEFIETIEKSKSSAVIRATPYLTINTLPDVVLKEKFPSLSLGWYLLCVVVKDISTQR